MRVRKEAQMDSLTGLFCLIDDFCQELEPALDKQLLEHGQRQRSGACRKFYV
jgi:hypothetical protein